MFVEIEKVSFKYAKGSKNILNEFNLEIMEGNIVAILGESGCGKSTLLRILAGLEEPYQGRIMINKQIVLDKHTFVPPEKRGVGMVFQDYALFPHKTVKQNIQYGLKNKSKLEKEQITDRMLSLTGLEEYKEQYPYELSGGQQQRVAIARSLAPNPKLLLLDEPFSNLDSNLQVRIRDELKTILKTTGITSIFVTHNKEDADAIADDIITLS